MAVFKCKMCGAPLGIEENKTVTECEYCGTKQTLPKLEDERKANLYDRANHFRRNNEFDKAMSIYENILNEDKTDAESYWSIVLCRYGIEYVEDPVNHKRVPTVNRAQFTSVFMDEDYKSAIEYADALQREIYESEAKAIDEIQKGILEISQKEEPFDVFICYKETDSNGRRTPDSVLATELYHELQKEGFKVFFSRITLEDKLGSAYEPYIFAALNSAKVMVVLGTKQEYFNAVWVKNEWSRFLTLIKNGARKTLIPAYKDMDPYDLPEEFSHLQAQDMTKLGFMQDLIRGIRKIAGEDVKPATVETNSGAAPANTNTATLLERVFIFLEDGDWENADEYCEKVLDIEPKNSEAYFGKLLAEFKAKDENELINTNVRITESNNYRRIIRFGDETIMKKLDEIAEKIAEKAAIEEEKEKKRLEEEARRREEERKRIEEAERKRIADENDKQKNNLYFSAIRNIPADSIRFYALGSLKNTVETLRKLGDFKDSQNYIDKCYHIIYKNAILNSRETDAEYRRNAYVMFDYLGDYLDSRERKEKLGIRNPADNNASAKSPFKNLFSKRK
ncbi:MAG: toll/interleukin-1 receptor domain-containing protein [Ruminococcaceae bacterium]|nr:toll/interleukin-1 receptor domain-containing protein [Oscillospiraceae bacterium]